MASLSYLFMDKSKKQSIEVKGYSTRTDHKEWIEVTEWSYCAASYYSHKTKTVEGDTACEPLLLSAKSSSATASLYALAWSRDRFDCKLHVIGPGFPESGDKGMAKDHGEKIIWEVRLTDAILLRIQSGSPAGADFSSDHFDLLPKKMEFEYKGSSAGKKLAVYNWDDNKAE